MNYKIITLPFFEKQVKKLKRKYPNIKQDIQKLKDILSTRPKDGKSLGRSIYKIRIASSDVKKGKRGGFRVIYYIRDKDEIIYLLTIYSKAKKEDIEMKEINKILKELDP